MKEPPWAMKVMHFSSTIVQCKDLWTSLSSVRSSLFSCLLVRVCT